MKNTYLVILFICLFIIFMSKWSVSHTWGAARSGTHSSDPHTLVHEAEKSMRTAENMTHPQKKVAAYTMALTYLNSAGMMGVHTHTSRTLRKEVDQQLRASIQKMNETKPLFKPLFNQV